MSGGDLSGFVAGVDRLLSGGHGLFPASGGTGVGGNDPGGQLPPAPAGGGQLGAGATQAADDYQQAQAAVSSLGDETSAATGDANAVGTQGRAQSGSIVDAARTQAAAIGPMTDQPAGVKLMVSTMDQRLSDMQRELDTANAQNRLIAVRMRQVVAAYQGIAPQMGMGGAGMPFSGSGSAGGGSGAGGLSSLAGVPATLMSASGAMSPNRIAQGAANQSGSGAPIMSAAVAAGGHPTKEQEKAYALSLFPRYGWGPEQMPALDALWTHESGDPSNPSVPWNPKAHNASGASGLAQFMPYCTPLNTEILTERGWVTFDKVQIGDRTLGLNPVTGLTEWTPVLEVVVFPQAHHVVKIGNSRWSARTTPNHRWWSVKTIGDRVEPWVDGTTCPECGISGTKKNDQFSSQRSLRSHRALAHGVPPRVFGYRKEVAGFVTFADLTTKHELVLSAPADTEEKLDISPTEAELLGWLAGDGHTSIGGRCRGLGVTLYQAKLHRVAEIKELLATIGVPYTEHCRDRGNPLHQMEQSWYFPAAYARDLLSRSQHVQGWEAMVRSMSAVQRKAWLNGVIAAEGDTVRSGPDGRITRISQSKGDMLDAIVLAVYMEGYRPSVRWRRKRLPQHSDAAVVTLARPGAHAWNLKILGESWEPVWCVRTEHGTWTMRQGDQISLTGNTLPYFTQGNEHQPWQHQIERGLDYIADRYKNPAAAWAQYYNHPGGEGSY